MNHVLVLATIAGLMTVPAYSNSTYFWGYGEVSSLTLQDSESCIAELVIVNKISGGDWDWQYLVLGDVSVAVNMISGVGESSTPDEFIIHVPANMIAIPQEVVIKDNEQFTIQICSVMMS